MALIADAVLLTVSAATEVATASIAMIPLIISAVVHAVVTVIPVIMTAARHTGGTVTRTTVVSTIPAVMHTYMMVMMSTVVIAVAVIVAVTAMAMPGMSSAIGHIEVRISEVEIFTVRVAEIDAEVPVASLPVQGTVEIGCCHKGVPLPVVEDITHVEVTTLPIGAEHVCTSCDTHEVVEVDLIRSLILLFGQIQLVRHLVGEEQGLIASLLVTHCFG